ncbi:MAG: carboxypeptidase regulatory-like domain-containing protein [Pseudogulbenkiania sp.]|nr:carboxypeptidase regulatory-like domain-containing protein [Pseudogulbenkiania sp.]
MTSAQKSWLPGLLLALLLGAGPAMADETEALPKAQTQGQVAFLSGGIGAEEAEAMKAVRQDYNLQLLFAGKGSGEYLAHVAVVVRNARGDAVLDTVADGPYLYARLPSGQYQVSASYNDQSQTRKVRLGRRSSALAFYW